MGKRIVQFASVALCLTLASCVLPRSAWYTLRVKVENDANERTPVPVDFVLVWDKAVAGKVATLTAADWFATKKTELRQDDPDERKLTVCEWEWVPGQAVPEINLAVPAAARKWTHGVFVFANYRSAGTHRSSVTPGVAAMLELGRDDLTVRPDGKATFQQHTPDDEQACQAPPRK